MTPGSPAYTHNYGDMFTQKQRGEGFRLTSGDVASGAGPLHACGFANSSPLSLDSLSPKPEHGVRDWFWWQKPLEAPDSTLGQACLCLCAGEF